MPDHDRFLASMRGPEVGPNVDKAMIAVLPLGAIEQHGPHLPLSTDFVIADAVAGAVAQRFGAETGAWFLPTLPFTKSNEHAWSAGTIWLSAGTMLAMIDDVARSVAASGFGRLLFLNGHGGNSSLLSVACREVRLKHGLQTFLAHPHMPADQGGASASGELGMGVHGGFDETSVMLHLRPDLVDMSRAIRRVPEGMAANKHVKFGGSTPFGWLSNDFFPEGHIGDPTGANADAGATMFATAVDTLGEVLREISTFDFGR